MIDYEDMDALNESVSENASAVAKKEISRSKSSSKRTSRDKPRQPTNQSSKRPALVVQQLPPPMLLPPYVVLRDEEDVSLMCFSRCLAKPSKRQSKRFRTSSTPISCRPLAASTSIDQSVTFVHRQFLFSSRKPEKREKSTRKSHK